MIGSTNAVGIDVKSSAARVGDTKITARNDLGDKWLLCNGDKIDAAKYPELYPLLKGNMYEDMASVDFNIGTGEISALVYENNMWVAVIAGSTTGIGICYAPSLSGPWSTTYIDTSDMEDYIYPTGIAYGNGYWVLTTKDRPNAKNSKLRLYTTKNIGEGWTGITINGQASSTSLGFRAICFAEGKFTAIAYSGLAYGSLDVYTATNPTGQWTRTTFTANTAMYGPDLQLVYGNGYWVLAQKARKGAGMLSSAYVYATQNPAGTWSENSSFVNKTAITNIVWSPEAEAFYLLGLESSSSSWLGHLYFSINPASSWQDESAEFDDPATINNLSGGLISLPAGLMFAITRNSYSATGTNLKYYPVIIDASSYVIKHASLTEITCSNVAVAVETNTFQEIGVVDASGTGICRVLYENLNNINKDAGYLFTTTSSGRYFIGGAMNGNRVAVIDHTYNNSPTTCNVYVSTDGGNSFSTTPTIIAENALMMCIYHLNGKWITVGSQNGAAGIWEATNPSGTWTKVQSAPDGTIINDIDFDGTTYVAVGTYMDNTTQRGAIWTAATLEGPWTLTKSFGSEVNRIYYFDEPNLWVALSGINKGIQYSSDGNTWTALDMNVYASAQAPSAPYLDTWQHAEYGNGQLVLVAGSKKTSRPAPTSSTKGTVFAVPVVAGKPSQYGTASYLQYNGIVKYITSLDTWVYYAGSGYAYMSKNPLAEGWTLFSGTGDVTSSSGAAICRNALEIVGDVAQIIVGGTTDIGASQSNIKGAVARYSQRGLGVATDVVIPRINDVSNLIGIDGGFAAVANSSKGMAYTKDVNGITGWKYYQMPNIQSGAAITTGEGKLFYTGVVGSNQPAMYTMEIDTEVIEPSMIGVPPGIQLIKYANDEIGAATFEQQNSTTNVIKLYSLWPVGNNQYWAALARDTADDSVINGVEALEFGDDVWAALLKKKSYSTSSPISMMCYDWRSGDSFFANISLSGGYYAGAETLVYGNGAWATLYRYDDTTTLSYFTDIRSKDIKFNYVIVPGFSENRVNAIEYTGAKWIITGGGSATALIGQAESILGPWNISNGSADISDTPSIASNGIVEGFVGKYQSLRPWLFFTQASLPVGDAPGLYTYIKAKE